MKSTPTVTTVSSTLKSPLNLRARLHKKRCNFRAEETAVTVGEIFSPEGYDSNWYYIRDPRGQAVSNMVSEFILLLFSASGDVRKGGKGVNFGVILENRLSGAE